MVPETSLLIVLVLLLERIPVPARAKRRGRPMIYPDRLFLKAWVIMIVRQLPRVHSLLAVLEQPTDEMQRLRALLTEDGRYPTRRTFERRLKTMPETLPAQIGCLGRGLVEMINPWADSGHAAAIDSTVLRANGGGWHKSDRDKGVVPHTSIDTEAHWTKSGWHGWVDGWKLHLVTTVATVWIPLAADLTSAHVADNVEAPLLLPALPTELRFLLGDKGYHDPDLEHLWETDERVLVTTVPGRYPHDDTGVEVRRLFHCLRSRAIENFNEQFKGIFHGHGQVPTRGLIATRRFILGAVLVYQLALLYRYETQADLRIGLKPFLQAA